MVYFEFSVYTNGIVFFDIVYTYNVFRYIHRTLYSIVGAWQRTRGSTDVVPQNVAGVFLVFKIAGVILLW